MSWLDKLERKYGRYAIPNISRYFIFISLIGFVVSMAGLDGLVGFSWNAILHGQVWRLVTWVLYYPGGSGFFGLLFLLIMFSWGESLEQIIGTFRMNVYIFGGILITLLGGIIVGIIGFPAYISTYYILLSIMMALAICIPDAQVNLYFVIPIRMKWMLVVYFLELGYELYSYYSLGRQYYGGVMGGLMAELIYGTSILCALLNMGLFFWTVKPRLSRKQKKRHREFQAQFAQPRPGSGITRHKCTICGRTELDSPELSFRYCSKCAGSHEYCQDHLFTHEHIHFS